ncbi:MAG: family 78 glycoside hydrolase catalytic domain [Bacteroidales bacterium]|jgi:alpha-L-rhamnosidase|nr:family 78 glycoside hydrolase catalytic domain [Bacteroidales bacterium]
MSKSLLFIGLLFLFQLLSAQYPNHQLPQYPITWNSNWITHPDIDEAAYGLIHFRNDFTLKEVPENFIVHVSGDNRYRLYVNGEEVCYGPQLADMRHWRYETIDLAPFLQVGKNIIAAEVMNWGIERSYGIISFKTAFLLQGNSEKESIINTGYNSTWKVLLNEGIFEKTVFWRSSGEIVGGFYAANPTDSIVAEKYPWNWKNSSCEDLDWKAPEVVFSYPKTDAGAGHGWILQPRTTAIQVNSIEHFTKITRSTIKDLNNDFHFGKKAVKIPSNSTHSILIDQGYVTLGFPKLNLSGGKNAKLKITYSEALYDENNQKGNRNEIDNKVIKGISDIYIMDGGERRIFQPIWFRTFRFIQLDIETGNEALFINDYFNMYSASSFPVKATFECNNPLYKEVWDICWHGMKICAQDNLMSDAYYEQMQYVGDLRPHLQAWTTLTGDLTYFKSAIEQFNNSRLPDGNITSCYPLKATFVHPTYSLIWIDMIHDLMLLDGDEELLKPYLGEIEEVFEYYESLINEQGLVGKSNYMMFVDWYLPKSGNSEANKNGNSAILTLNYAYTLKKAAEIVSWLGNSKLAKEYTERSLAIAKTVREKCFNPEKGIYADDPAQTFYDQRASILAVLTGGHSKTESKELMMNLLNPQTKFDSYANLFYYFYLFEAMEKTEIGDFTALLKPWKDIVDMGMCATPEKRIEQNPRSEVHPWTAHPVNFYFSVVAGIRPASPGYDTVIIAPNPGELKNIHAVYPTKHVSITIDLEFNKGKAKGRIYLPGNVSGKFSWNNNDIELNSGTTTL